MATYNKKVKNATLSILYDIKFKSKLEKGIYKFLKEKNIDVKYEPLKCTIWDSGKFTVPYFNKIGRKGFMQVLSKPIAIHYTPDFIFKYNGYEIFLEAKGFTNDVFPYKAKLFRQWLEDYSKKENKRVCYAVVYSIKNVSSLLEYLNNL